MSSQVQSFTVLRKGHARSDEALALLQRIASLVKPLMKRHGWTLPVLGEMFPSNPNLLGLNVNRGSKILLRLRPHYDKDNTFLELEDLLATMRHECCHNSFGPHDEKFYAFLAELDKEFEEDRSKGWQGEGFHAPGSAVGGDRRLTVVEAREKAVKEAERRLKLNLLLGKGGKLGGARSTKSPRELAAEAAERRARDAKTCAQSSDIAAIVRATDLNSTVIDLTGDDSDHDENRQPEAGPSGTRQSPIDLDSSSPSSSSSEDRRPSDRSRRRPHDRPATPSQVPLKKAKTAVADASETWTCPRCTLVNANNVDACEACLARGPGPRTAEGWTCHQCGLAGNPHARWSCSRCFEIKQSS